jgi:rhodanese-related sulfurtransferase
MGRFKGGAALMSTEGYAGDVDSRQAIDILRNNPRAVLLDVRSAPEWDFVGRPNLSGLGREPVFIAWQSYPGMEKNQSFLAEIDAQGVTPDQIILLLCRSGQRSKHAATALTKRGYQHCFNISDGFEGPKNTDGHRGAVSGWQASGLPWVQG